MVKRCCLFSQMKEKEILFIVNNMKPLTLYISNKLIKEGTDVNYLYLVSSGVLSLWKTGIDIN
jgi:signal-transduction protein with cAMP-binding, CBS, and nucleotidyltransferase domain